MTKRGAGASGPEGGARGWRRWACMAACGGLFLVVNIHRYAVGTLAGPLMAEFGATAVEIGGLASLYFYLYGFLQVPSGILADTWGPRRTLLLSGVCLALGAGLFAWARALPAAYAGRILVGLGAAAVFVNAMRLVATWFDPWQFATLVGLINLAGTGGGFLAGAPLAATADAMGWRGAFWGLGAFTVLASAASWVAVRDRPPAAEAAGGPPRVRAVLRASGAVLRHCEIWKALVVKTGMDSANFSFFALWGVPYLSQAYAMPRVTASRFISVAVVGFALGAPCMGLLSDRVFRSRRIPLLLAGAVYMLSWAAVFFPPGGPRGPLLFGAAAFGMSFAASSLLLTLSVARDISPPEAAGVATSLVNAGGFIGAAVFQILTSAILDFFWEGGMARGARAYPPHAFRAAFAVCVAAIAVSLVAAWNLREPACR